MNLYQNLNTKATNPNGNKSFDLKTEADAALALLAEAKDACAAELENYAQDSDISETDSETDSGFPVFNAIYDSGGSATILSTTNFSAAEFKIVGFKQRSWFRAIRMSVVIL